MVDAACLILDGEKANPKCKGKRKCGGSGFVTIYNPDAFTYTCECITSKRTPAMWEKAKRKAREINSRLCLF